MKNKLSTKKGRILKHLQGGRTLTQLQCLRLYGSLRLAPTICRLRKEGYPVETNIIYNLLAEGYAEYYMKQ